jgi:prepilin peptidase CpaA
MDTWLVAGGWQVLSDITLVVLLGAAASVDIREHRIPNIVVFSGVAIALLLAHLPGGSVSHLVGGIAVGMAMTLPMYWLRTMGAGDVKLMGMVGAFLGAGDMFAAGLVVFVVGGLLGVVAAARRHAVAQLGDNVKQMVMGGVANVLARSGPAIEPPVRSVGVQPYGVSIALGTILYLAMLKGGLIQ